MYFLYFFQWFLIMFIFFRKQLHHLCESLALFALFQSCAISMQRSELDPHHYFSFLIRQPHMGTYTRRLISCEHPPSMPVHISIECCMFYFPETIYILWWQTSRYLNELVIEGKSRQARIPAENKSKQAYYSKYVQNKK